MSSPLPDQRFPKSRRLLNGRDFDGVMRQKVSHASGPLVVYVAGAISDCGRLGLVVGRRYGKAVHRNRFKRLVREWFRLRDWGAQGVDVVVVARPRAKAVWASEWPDLQGLSAHLERALAGAIRKLGREGQAGP